MSMCGATWHWAEEMYRVWESLPAALRSGKPERPFFASLQGDRSRRHREAMAAYARTDYVDIARWIPMARHRVVLDAGGGCGVLLGELLRAGPHLEGILFDRPDVVADLDLPSSVLGGDLFEPWPAQADAIILARVLHDWNDKDARRILELAREALVPDGRIYVVERVDAAAMLDLHMLVSTGGRERKTSEFSLLFEECGLALSRTTETPRGFAVLEVRAQ
jgi:hypothetical protein